MINPLFEKIAAFIGKKSAPIEIKTENEQTKRMLDALRPSSSQEDFEPEELVDVVRECLENGASPLAKKKLGSIKKNHIQVVNYPTLFSLPQPALALAVVIGNANVCKQLIKAGAIFDNGVLEAVVWRVNQERKPYYPGGWRPLHQPVKPIGELSQETKDCLSVLATSPSRTADFTKVFYHDAVSKNQNALKIIQSGCPSCIAEIQLQDLQENTSKAVRPSSKRSVNRL